MDIRALHKKHVLTPWSARLYRSPFSALDRVLEKVEEWVGA